MGTYEVKLAGGRVILIEANSLHIKESNYVFRGPGQGMSHGPALAAVPVAQVQYVADRAAISSPQ